MLKTSFRTPVDPNHRFPILVFYHVYRYSSVPKINTFFVPLQVLTDRSPLLTQIFSTDCRDALGQMLEAQVRYLQNGEVRYDAIEFEGM
jgi:hypothetical protein